MNKRGFSIIYLIFVISVVFGLGVIVLNKQNYLIALSQRSEIQNLFLKEITAKYQTVVNSFSLDGVGTQKSLVGFIPNNLEYYNIFWQADNMRNFFSGALLLDTDNYKKIDDVTSFYIDLDVEDIFSFKIIQWDKGYYNLSSQLVPLAIQEYTYNSGQVGFLQNDGTISNSTGALYSFDTSHDYAFFIKTGSGVVGDYVRYELRAYDALSGSGLYINPVYQENSKNVYMGYDIKKIENSYLFKILNF